jgi:hypothetical protein
MMDNQIPEIEFNFSNCCTGRCFICAQAHGRGNILFMLPEVFEAACEQLKDVQFETIQTSGNGDCFLHFEFLHWLQTLRSEFPHATIVNYSNFALYTAEWADAILGSRLIDEQFTRIDSLTRGIFQRSTGLNQAIVFSNLERFIRQNTSVKLTIGYSSIPQYHRKCWTVLGKKPFHSPFTSVEVAAMTDEYQDIIEHFSAIPTGRPVQFYRINQSLWAEREDPKTPADPDSPCPKLAGRILDRVLWICPNGNVSVCGYDDSQNTFICGNILREHILGIWNGERRQQLLEDIRQRRTKTYPCNPQCCQLYGDCFDE